MTVDRNFRFEFCLRKFIFVFTIEAGDCGGIVISAEGMYLFHQKPFEKLRADAGKPASAFSEGSVSGSFCSCRAFSERISLIDEFESLLN